MVKSRRKLRSSCSPSRQIDEDEGWELIACVDKKKKKLITFFWEGNKYFLKHRRAVKNLSVMNVACPRKKLDESNNVAIYVDLSR